MRTKVCDMALLNYKRIQTWKENIEHYAGTTEHRVQVFVARGLSAMGLRICQRIGRTDLFREEQCRRSR